MPWLIQEEITEGQAVMYILALVAVQEDDDRRMEELAKKGPKKKDNRAKPEKSFKEMTGEEAMNWTNMMSGGKF